MRQWHIAMLNLVSLANKLSQKSLFTRYYLDLNETSYNLKLSALNTLFSFLVSLFLLRLILIFRSNLRIYNAIRSILKTALNSVSWKQALVEEFIAPKHAAYIPVLNCELEEEKNIYLLLLSKSHRPHRQP